MVFARKPAPIQVTYLAYCSTTGLDAIDYRLTDPFLDPEGNDDLYTERSVRLPQTYWCYEANPAAPAVSPLPARTSGYVSFACLNSFCKVTPATLAAWAMLLKAVPDSRLILNTGEGKHRDGVRDVLGVDKARLTFVSRVPMQQYFERYHQIDIALDPFPYTGGTTTCDALWMGVPVVSLAGDTAVSRSGLSILSNICHDEWVARTADDYVRVAAALACNLKQLTGIRESLREQMQRSPLMDARRFAADVEAAYRWMWRKWCDGM
jgi:predicted O-linked N-acetylglucosamine transferase (SPINDLY family)